MFTSFSPLLRTAYLLGLATIFTFSSCKDENGDDIQPAATYEVPATYNFANANYSGQTTRISMLTAMNDYVKAGNIQGTILDAQKMRDMYANQNTAFANSALDNSGKQLKDKTYSAHQAIFESYFDSLAVASHNPSSGSEGKAGVVPTATAGKAYLLSAKGIEYGQLIQKRMMGAVFYYQAMETYLTETKLGAGVDNSTVKEGEGTAMEHAFDEAFGYFGALPDFPNNASASKYWANYSNQVNPALGSNKTIMDAFLKGRAAISNKDMNGKYQAIGTIRNEWERIVAASAIHEMNAAKTELAKATRDNAQISHYLSEAIGFIYALQYKSDRKINDTQINSVISKFGANLYRTTAADVEAAKAELANIYGFNTIKDAI
jgi:hypothetical protein